MSTTEMSLEVETSGNFVLVDSIKRISLSLVYLNKSDKTAYHDDWHALQKYGGERSLQIELEGLVPQNTEAVQLIYFLLAEHCKNDNSALRKYRLLLPNGAYIVALCSVKNCEINLHPGQLHTYKAQLQSCGRPEYYVER